MLRGIGVSGGCGVGRAFVFAEIKLPAAGAVSDTSVTREKERLAQASAAFDRLTAQQAQTLRKALGEQYSAVLEAQRTILSDPFLCDAIQKNLDKGAVAEEAVNSAFASLYTLFESAKDVLLQQKITDVQAVHHGLLRLLTGVSEPALSALPQGSVAVVRELTPSMVCRISPEQIAAVVAETGSYTSHSAILARAKGIPVVMAVPDATERIKNHERLLVDGAEGRVLLSPRASDIRRYTARQPQQEHQLLQPTAFGCMAPQIYGNISSVEEAVTVLQNGGEGIGLFRTEFLLMNRLLPPSEEEQLAAYAAVARAVGAGEVVIRTFDIGGDKTPAYLREEGVRGVRCLLQQPALFRTQLRAVMRAAAAGNVKMLLPMITAAKEITAVKSLLEECASALRAEGTPFRLPPLGVMIETPAAVLTADDLAKEADFFSIGTNDLTALLLGDERGNAVAKSQCGSLHPALLRAIQMTVTSAERKGIPVSICGEAAADPALLPRLLQWKIEMLSVCPSAIPGIKNQFIMPRRKG